MHGKRWLLVGVAALAMMAGCEDSAAPAAGDVAVVDVERVFTALGRDQQLQAQAQQMQEQFQAFEAQLVEQLQEAAARDARAATQPAGESGPVATQPAGAAAATQPATEPSEEFLRLRQDLSQQRQAAMGQFSATMNQLQSQTYSQFIEELSPVAVDVATRRGMKVVLQKQAAGVLGQVPEADITDEVIAEMSKGVGGAGGLQDPLGAGGLPGAGAGQGLPGVRGMPGDVPGRAPGQGGQAPLRMPPQSQMPGETQPPPAE